MAYSVWRRHRKGVSEAGRGNYQGRYKYAQMVSHKENRMRNFIYGLMVGMVLTFFITIANAHTTEYDIRTKDNRLSVVDGKGA